jgi:phosphoglycerate dehydrogenase-like enzyme
MWRGYYRSWAEARGDVSLCQGFHSSSSAGFIPLRRQVHQLLFSKLVNSKLVNSDIVVTNSREVHPPVVAEHGMALIFALAKKIPRAARLQQKPSWGQEVIRNEGPRRREIAGSTLGLTGVESIGRRVAPMASAVGMCLIAARAGGQGQARGRASRFRSLGARRNA